MPRLFLAIPTHSGDLSVQTAVTIFNLQNLAHRMQTSVSLQFFSGAVIGELRNLMVADFLASDDDCLVMVDSDQGIPAELIMRMVATEHPVVGCICPKRRYHWDPIEGAVQPASTEQLLRQATRYVGRLLTDDDGQPYLREGFAKASYVGAGVLVIRRTALQTMMEKMPELQGIGFANEHASAARIQHNWAFFSQVDPRQAGQYMSEDISFCYRWRELCGGEVWANVDTAIEHVGRVVFAGSLVEHLQALEAPVPDAKEAAATGSGAVAGE